MTSLDSLHEQSARLTLHAHRLKQEFNELREASKLLRIESMRLMENVRMIRRSGLALRDLD